MFQYFLLHSKCESNQVSIWFVLVFLQSWKHIKINNLMTRWHLVWLLTCHIFLHLKVITMKLICFICNRDSNQAHFVWRLCHNSMPSTETDRWDRNYFQPFVSSHIFIQHIKQFPSFFSQIIFLFFHPVLFIQLTRPFFFFTFFYVISITCINNDYNIFKSSN